MLKSSHGTLIKMLTVHTFASTGFIMMAIQRQQLEAISKKLLQEPLEISRGVAVNLRESTLLERILLFKHFREEIENKISYLERLCSPTPNKTLIENENSKVAEDRSAETPKCSRIDRITGLNKD